MTSQRQAASGTTTAAAAAARHARGVRCRPRRLPGRLVRRDQVHSRPGRQAATMDQEACLLQRRPGLDRDRPGEAQSQPCEQSRPAASTANSSRLPPRPRSGHGRPESAHPGQRRSTARWPSSPPVPRPEGRSGGKRQPVAASGAAGPHRRPPGQPPVHRQVQRRREADAARCRGQRELQYDEATRAPRAVSMSRPRQRAVQPEICIRLA